MTAETNVERLEDIKQWHEDDGELHQFDIDWLIEQVERAQELEEQINSHAPEGRNYTNQQYVELRWKYQRYKETLESVAKNTSCDDTWDFVSRVLQGDEPSDLPYRMN